VKSEQVIFPYTPCGNQLVANIYEYGNTGVSFGTVTVGNDAANLYITYQTSGSYLLQTAALYVGTAEGLTGKVFNPPAQPNVLNPDGTGYFHIGYFPTIYSPGPPAPTYQKVIPLSELPDCFVIVAFAEITTKVGEKYSPYITASAKAPTLLKSSGYYLDFCKQQCKEPTCETAYAFGGNVATCFLNLTGFPLSANNWGWTNYINGPIEKIHWPIYAGAGQCNITKGKLVGYLDGSYVGGKLNLTYNITSPFNLNTTHLYIGKTPLPEKNGKWVTAPGQFRGTGPIVDLSIAAPFYVAAHSEVCGPY
jgi:hypothetical protein